MFWIHILSFLHNLVCSSVLSLLTLLGMLFIEWPITFWFTLSPSPSGHTFFFRVGWVPFIIHAS